SVRALFRRMLRLEEKAGRQPQATAEPLLATLRGDPAQLLVRAGLPPDPWQAALLRSSAPRQLLLCSRQAGKSQTAAAVALKTALLHAGSLTLLLSPSLRQSGE